MDRIVYGTKLAIYHIIGIGCMVLCAVLISLAGIFIKPKISEESQTEVDPSQEYWYDDSQRVMAVILAVAFALASPVFFTLRS